MFAYRHITMQMIRIKVGCWITVFVSLLLSCLVLIRQPELPFLLATTVVGGTGSVDNVPRRAHAFDSGVVRAMTGSCQKKRPPSSVRLHGVWYESRDSNSSTTTCIFGAYLDDRVNVKRPVVRLFTVTDGPVPILPFCYLWYRNVTFPFVVQVSKSGMKNVGRGYTYRGIKYQERLFNCDLPDRDVVPEFVSLVYSKCGSPENAIPVHIPSKSETPLEIGICVAVSYDIIEPLKLVEWIEFNNLLGVSGIHIYNSSIAGRANDVLNHYSRSGVVHLNKAAPPLNAWCKYCQKLAVIAAFNDCMYRNMYAYHYIMVIDFDELIVPYYHDTLPHLLQNLEGFSGLRQPAFMFRNSYYFLDYGSQNGPKNKRIDLFTMKYLTRTSTSEKGYASKSITNPRRCIVLQNHYCVQRTTDVGIHWTKHVDSRYAVVHHYKKCHFSPGQCRRHLADKITDTSVLKYNASLTKAVESARRHMDI